MKIKHFFPAALMAIATTACTSDDVVSTPQTAETPISFNAYTGNMTRAANSFCSANPPSAFNIWAYTSNGAYFEGDEVQNESGTWTDKTAERTWPKFDALDFYAVVDDDGKAAGKTVDEFTVKPTVAEQLDLMYAVTTGLTEKENGSTVTLNFHHALSQICFMAQNNDPGSAITITEISLSGLKGSGTFTLPTSTTLEGPNQHYDQNDNEQQYADPNKAPAGGTWNTDGVASSASYSLTGLSIDLGQPIGNAPGKVVNISVPRNTEHTATTPKDRAMNLIPQKVGTVNSEGKVSDGATLTIKLESGESIKKNIAIDWKPGYRYIYTIIINTGGKIEYKVKVADFVDEVPDAKFNNHEAVLMVPAADNKNTALYVATQYLGADHTGSYVYKDGKYYCWGGDCGYYLSGVSVYDDTPYNNKKNTLETYTSTKSYSELASEGWIYTTDDANYILTPAHDIVQKQWGGGWRMPTRYELEKLLNECCTVEKAEDGKYGFYLTSNKTKAKVFLPALGRLKNDDSDISNEKVNEELYLWTSTIDFYEAIYYWNVKYDESEGKCKVVCEYSTNKTDRCFAMPILPVISVPAVPATTE